ncbi:PucR family transcriptional regulator [Corynebacterium sp. sy017]|nr:PucR family transcriptional regulator [Corynebacterium sp. sy017]MBP3088287.1 PucR family transcriptional regulator [Corynebacterium sp. sy017]TSD91611.1 PucR family transcriptional regulator [Corynebacterium sp. SY003]
MDNVEVAVVALAQAEKYLTLSWLLAQHSLELESLCPAQQPFSVVQPSELPDPTQFIVRNSIVLTVGIAFEHCPEQFHDYVACLKEAGVVAIGFGVGLIFAAAPQQLIDACAHHNIGLFIVPKKIPFVSILNVVTEEFSRQDKMEHEQFMHGQKVLNHAALSHGISGLLSQTAALIGGSCTIIDNDNRTIAHVAYAETDREPLHRVEHKMLSSGDRFHTLITHSVLPLSRFDRDIIKHSIGLADLLLQRPVQLRKARTELNTLALSVLLGFDGNEEQLRRIFSRISDNHGNVRPVLIQAHTQAHINKAFRTIDAQLSANDRELCAIMLNEHSALLLFRASRSIDNILTLFGESKEQLKICIDTTHPWQDIDSRLVEQLNIATKALAIGTHSSPQNSPLRWLANPNVMQALDARAKITLDRLRSYDAQHHTELYDTLSVFLQQGSNITTSSATLGIHRHTMRSRLHRIAGICEINLDDPVTCAEMLLVVISRPSSE